MKPNPESHACMAILCRIQIRKSLFMCPAHWMHLPQELRSDLWHSYRQWRQGSAHVEYILATKRAQRFIAEFEGRDEYVVTLDPTIEALEARLRRAQNAETL